MKKLLIGFGLVAVLLVGCGNTEVRENIQRGSGGFLITVGYDKNEWYISEQKPYYGGYTTTIYYDGLEYYTNDVVSVYPFRNDEELDIHMKKLKLDGKK